MINISYIKNAVKYLQFVLCVGVGIGIVLIARKSGTHMSLAL